MREPIRRILVTLLATAFIVGLPSSSSAHHRPNTYCSQTGDICQSAAKVDGVRKFRLTLAAKYFDHYDLCVIEPGDSKTCKTFRVKKQGSFYGDTVRWDTNFPDEGSGAYDVAWKMTSGDRFGKKLGFHS